MSALVSEALLSIRHWRLEFDQSDLPAVKRRIRCIFGHADRTFCAASLGPVQVTSDTPYVGVVEHLNSGRAIGCQESKACIKRPCGR
jgi:hypothetical protein